MREPQLKTTLLFVLVMLACFVVGWFALLGLLQERR